MSGISIEAFAQGLDAIVAWDIDGVLCPVSAREKRLNRIWPSAIPRFQTFFQSPRRPFLEWRQSRSHTFLTNRQIDEAAVTALLLAHAKKLEFAAKGIVVKNAIFTERPKTAHDLILDQLTARLLYLNGGATTPELIDSVREEGFCKRNGLLPVTSTHEFVLQSFSTIKTGFDFQKK